MRLYEITIGIITSLSVLIDLKESLVLLAEESYDSSHMPLLAFCGQPKTYETLAPSFQRILTTKKSVGASDIIKYDLIQTFRIRCV